MSEKTLLNWFEVFRTIKYPDERTRYNGGWLKKVEKIDKEITTGYSIIGEFVSSGDFKEYYEDGLYIDCNKDGTRSKPKNNYRLIKINNGHPYTIKELMNANRGWAVELWDHIELEIPQVEKNKKEQAINLIDQAHSLISQETFEKIIMNKLSKETRKKIKSI